MPKLLINSFQTRSSLQVKHVNSRVTEKDVRPKSFINEAAQIHQIIVSSIDWLLGFFQTIAFLASTTWLHGNFEWQWHLLNPLPFTPERRFYNLNNQGDYSCLTTEEDGQLDDYLPCRQLDVVVVAANDYDNSHLLHVKPLTSLISLHHQIPLAL